MVHIHTRQNELVAVQERLRSPSRFESIFSLSISNRDPPLRASSCISVGAKSG